MVHSIQRGAFSPAGTRHRGGLRPGNVHMSNSAAPHDGALESLPPTMTSSVAHSFETKTEVHERH